MSGDRTHSLHQVHISKSSFSPMKHWLQQSAVHQNELWLQCGGIADEHYCGGRGLQEGCGRDGRTGVWLQAGEKPAMTGRPSDSSLSPGSNSPFPGWRSCQECQGRPGTELGRRGPLRPTMAGQRRSHNPLSANISVRFF